MHFNASFSLRDDSGENKMKQYLQKSCICLLALAAVGCHSFPKPNLDGRLSALDFNLDSVTYRVSSGETLETIAFRYKTTVDELKRLNPRAGNGVSAGMWLRIRASTSGGALVRTEQPASFVQTPASNAPRSAPVASGSRELTRSQPSAPVASGSRGLTRSQPSAPVASESRELVRPQPTQATPSSTSVTRNADQLLLQPSTVTVEDRLAGLQRYEIIAQSTPLPNEAQTIPAQTDYPSNEAQTKQPRRIIRLTRSKPYQLRQIIRLMRCKPHQLRGVIRLMRCKPYQLGRVIRLMRWKPY